MFFMMQEMEGKSLYGMTEWDMIGTLDTIIPKRVVYDERLSDEMVVAKMIQNGNWKWP